MNNKAIDLHWWTISPNFGDLLAPWLAEKITGAKPNFVEKFGKGFVTVGSIISHVGDESIVWGTGSFGT